MNWKLEDIYINIEEWNKDYKKLSNTIDELEKYKGKLKERLEEFYIMSEEAEKTLEDLYIYAHMKYDLDLSNQDNEKKFKKIADFYAQIGEKLSWAEPELLSYEKKEIMEIVNSSKKLKEYSHHFDALYRSKEHILDEKSEKLLSYFGSFNSFPDNIYSAFRFSDSKPVKVKLSTGEVVEVMSQNYTGLLSSTEKQNDRKKIFEALYKNFEENKTVLSNIYIAVAKGNIAMAKARNYTGFLQMFLHGDNAPAEVYKTLIKVARENSKYVKKYIELKKKVLEYKKFHSYDRFQPLVTINSKYSYEEAKNMLFESIKELPKDYQEKVKKVVQDGYVDVKPNPSKTGGAYSTSTYNTHPYILMNFDGTLDSVSTLAHEAGHSVHALYSKENQPYATSGHSIFVAEVASTFLERNLLKYLLKNVKTKDEKIFILQKMIDEIVATFFRQTMFANLEYSVHMMESEGVTLNEEELSKLSSELYKDYYGIDLKNEPLKRFWWSYDPHFYSTPFYVYKYATCHTITSYLFKKYEKNSSAFDEYVDLLKAGADDYAFNQVLKRGVDLTKEETYKIVIEDLKELVENLDKLINE